MKGAYCNNFPVQIGESDTLDVEVTFFIHHGWPADNNPESPDPGERPFARVHEMRICRWATGRRPQDIRLNAPVMQPVIDKLERKIMEAFQWQ